MSSVRRGGLHARTSLLPPSARRQGAERLVLELEGDAHDEQNRRNYDAARAEFLEAAGYRVVCVRNRDVTRERGSGRDNETRTRS
ncbi:MAG: hypothetical protein DMD25_09840 [Gemmatimonadetes bacterium]|nr:MAG: hypothetical protein DMD27_08705 [Gemmatimonadota bacterium]PYP76762.1 MAG: hypothetical protein DMD25_09840 [Gemmatimonadota bacterium]